jgi:hypothetical protein
MDLLEETTGWGNCFYKDWGPVMTRWFFVLAFAAREKTIWSCHPVFYIKAYPVSSCAKAQDPEFYEMDPAVKPQDDGIGHDRTPVIYYRKKTGSHDFAQNDREKRITPKESNHSAGKLCLPAKFLALLLLANLIQRFAIDTKCSCWTRFKTTQPNFNSTHFAITVFFIG